MLRWVTELVVPSPTPPPPLRPPPPPTALQNEEEEKKEKDVAVLVAVPAVDALAESVGEVMLHVAEGRLEMAVLMLQQSEAELAAGEQGSERVAALRESLAASRVRVGEAVERELQTSAGKGDSAARFCKLLCMLGKGEEAHAVLVGNLEATFGTAAERVLAELQAGRDQGPFYVESASRVFSLFMDLVADHQGLLIQQFGVARFFAFVSALQLKCDALFAVLFENFLARRVRPTVKLQPNQEQHTENLGQLLDEMTKLSLRCEIFGAFVDQVNKEALEYARQIGQVDEGLQKHHDAIAAALRHSLVRRGNMESMSNYVVLELRFLQASLKKTRLQAYCKQEEVMNVAVAIPSKATPKKGAASVVVVPEKEDDCGFVDPDALFFVLDRSCQRGLTGRNPAIACSVLSAAGSQLEIDLFEWLAEAWEGPSSRSTRLFCALLDRMMMCSTLCAQLQTRLDGVAAKYFAEQPSAREKVHLCLEAFGAASRRLLDEARAKANRHVSVIAPSEAAGELLAQAEALAWDDRTVTGAGKLDLLAQSLCEAVRTLCRSYRDIEAAEAVQKLICHQIARWLAQQLEQLVARRRFSQSGGVGLEGVVQALLEALKPWCAAKELRAAFQRLRGICVVLSVEQANDVADLWDSVSSSLTVEEVRALAAKRIEFSAKDVAGLRLAAKIY